MWPDCGDLGMSEGKTGKRGDGGGWGDGERGRRGDGRWGDGVIGAEKETWDPLRQLPPRLPVTPSPHLRVTQSRPLGGPRSGVWKQKRRSARRKGRRIQRR